MAGKTPVPPSSKKKAPVKKGTLKAKSHTPGEVKAAAPPPKSQLGPEIVCIILIALGLLLVLSLYTKSSAGALGGFFNSILKGFFGFGAYLLPFIVITSSLAVLFSKHKQIGSKKIMMLCALFLIMISFVNVLNMKSGNLEDESIPTNALVYIRELYVNGSVANGGFFGGLFGNFFIKVIGRAGTYILFVSGAIILAILISGKSLFRFLVHIFAVADERISEYRSRIYYYDDDECEEERDFEEAYEEEEIKEKPKPKPKRKAATEKHINSGESEAGHSGYAPILEGLDRRDKKSYDFVVGSEDSHESEKLHLITEDIRRIPLKRDLGKSSRKPKGSEAPPYGPEDAVEAKLTLDPIDFESEYFSEGALERGMEIFVDTSRGSRDNITDDDVDYGYDFSHDIEVKGIGITDKPAAKPPRKAAASKPAEAAKPKTGKAAETPKPLKASKKKPEKAAPATAEEIESLIEKHNSEAWYPEGVEGAEYKFPPIGLLMENKYSASLSSKAQILENSRKLEETLKSFGIEARVVEVSKGPAVTRYEISPGVGVKVNQIAKLSDDLALNLASDGIRIEAPVPGKSVIGLEVPNKEVQAVLLREVIDDESFLKYPSRLAFAVGKDIAGNVVIADIAKMPHLLIAGSTGAGKSVCINTIITSILYKASPDEVKLLMIDPKVVELSVYNGIPHLLIPVVTDPKKASGALNWAVQEMDARYNLFAETVTRDLKGYNAYLAKKGEKPVPQIVIVIDELADLMMTAKGDVESAICRIAQKARAAGIHLVIATQRPSVDVITGLIKTNVPSRLAFAVASGVDSRTILDMAGAEKLLGKGDMLFSPVGISKPQRIQGAFISDKEVEHIVNFLKKGFETEYDPSMVEKITSHSKTGDITEDADEFLEEAVEFLVEKEKASVSMLQRRFRIGYNRAARLMSQLESIGVVGAEDGVKPRKVLMAYEELEKFKAKKSKI